MSDVVTSLVCSHGFLTCASKATIQYKVAVATTMVVLVRMLQRKVPVDLPQVRGTLAGMLRVVGCDGWDVGLWITTDATILKYNAAYRGIRKSTDILSFPFHEIEVPGQIPQPSIVDERNLGDMIVSAPYVARYCKRHGVPLEQRMPELLAHGMCHLMGYDHNTDEEEDDMVAREQELLRGYEALVLPEDLLVGDDGL